MTLITDGLMIAAALFAGAYCLVLSRRLRALKDLDSGVGGAIMRMTRALEDARLALEEAKAANRDGNKELKDLIVRAEAASGQLRILLSATRDLPTGPETFRSIAKAGARKWHEEEHDDAEAAYDRPRRPAAPSARHQPPPLASPRTPAPILEPIERDLRSAIRSASPLRRRPAQTPASEDDLLAALADFAGARG